MSGPDPVWMKAIDDAQASDEPFLKEFREIEMHMQMALMRASGLMQYVLDAEGDSDLHRKLQMYLVPNLHHWITGMQAGNMRDLRELFDRRAKNAAVEPQPSAHSGNGHEVLTAPKK